MFKDTPKGLLEAVLAVNKGTREKYIEEQRKKAKLFRKEGPAEEAAHSGAHKMAEELSGKQHKLDVAEPKGKLTAADFRKLRKEEVEQIDELKTSTLLRYATKANQSLIGGDRSKEDKRIKGIQMSRYKIQQRAKIKEEAEQVEDLVSVR